MSDYTRSTRECAFNDLRPELAQAIRAHAAAYELGNFERDILICAETTNEKRKKGGLFAKMLGGDPDPVHHTALVVTPVWFFSARSGGESGVAVLSARVNALTVRDYEPSLLPDHGLNITALWTDAREQSTLFCGLGQDAAGERVKSVLREAVAAAQ